MARYQFRPMQAGDLPLIRRWLKNPHVIEWWGDPDEQYALVSGDLDEPLMDQFIVEVNDRPFGYLQSFDVAAWPQGAFHDQPTGTRAIDTLIGDADMIERGHGSGLIRAFGDEVLAGGAPRIITDPDPTNGRAIRAYEKAGFRREGIVDTTDGPALLMVRTA
jgi:aminoglycoside 6'-N-acetyltransferase